MARSLHSLPEQVLILKLNSPVTASLSAYHREAADKKGLESSRDSFFFLVCFFTHLLSSLTHESGYEEQRQCEES